MSETRVIVVDDDPAVLESLRMVLEAESYKVTTYVDAEALLAALPQLSLSCIVTDVRMPGMTGLELIDRLIGQGYAEWPVIVISGHADVPMAVAALRSGAVNLLEKPFDPVDLINAIRDAWRSRRENKGSAPDHLLVRRVESLTARERQVLLHLVQGASSKVTALAMGISPRTVDVFRGNILRKMEVPNIAAVASSISSVRHLLSA